MKLLGASSVATPSSVRLSAPNSGPLFRRGRGGGSVVFVPGTVWGGVVIVAVIWVVPRGGPIAVKTRSCGALALPEACLEICLEACVLSVGSYGWRQSVDTKVRRSLISMARGLSGGLISIWDPNMFSKNSIWCDDSFIIIKGNWKNLVGDCFMVNIYGPQDHVSKLALWNRLTDFMHHHNGSYIMFGDMNARNGNCLDSNLKCHEKFCRPQDKINNGATNIKTLERNRNNRGLRKYSIEKRIDMDPAPFPTMTPHHPSSRN
ncbi:RNA-directed DNA polymerase, eukaryota, reverse transcriptase zinc-binding domain protein [Tanacetum coccineum]|uniref:RNA-directed DNA polymerase, eukaryota, reverse transcriptase zinc-binding domain protein n=1 Tax=Tanacetum coccineum TaxID=301880 RepID=A0ABQ4XUB3_9ASTR